MYRYSSFGCCILLTFNILFRRQFFNNDFIHLSVSCLYIFTNIMMKSTWRRQPITSRRRFKCSVRSLGVNISGGKQLLVCAAGSRQSHSIITNLAGQCKHLWNADWFIHVFLYYGVTYIWGMHHSVYANLTYINIVNMLGMVWTLFVVLWFQTNCNVVTVGTTKRCSSLLMYHMTDDVGQN